MSKLTKMVPVATPPQKANSGLSKSSVTSKSQAADLPAARGIFPCFSGGEKKSP